MRVARLARPPSAAATLARGGEALAQVLPGPFAGAAASTQPRPAPLAELCREAIDRSAALLLLVLASPVLALAAILVRFTSPGPVLFAQERVGVDGRHFRMLKLRSMVRDAESQEDRLASDGTDGPFFKVREDARVTAVGRWLRLTSIDELPQLWNVARGDMRLVGPRPLLVREHAALPSDVREWRARVKPGITGLWQVCGRSRTTAATRIRLDRLYVSQACFALDCLILLRTPAAVLGGDGAV